MTEARRYGLRSLRFKLVLASVLVEALMLSVLIWNSTRITSDALAEIFQDHVETLVPLMNANLANPLAQRDYANLDERLRHIVQRDSLVYIEVRDELGRIAASHGEVPKTAQLDASLNVSDHVYDQTFDITLAGLVIGHARYGLNVSSLEATVTALRNQGALVASTEIVLTILLLATLGALLTRHLQTLTQAAHAFAGGEYSVRVPAAGRDEVADTAHAFNAMANTLERDITERQRAEAVLQESERRFRATLENVQLLAVGLDTKGNINFCNDFLLARTGWQRDEVIGQHWFSMFLPASVQEPVRKMFQQAGASGDLPLHLENEIVTRAGDLRLVRWNNTVLRAADGRITGTVSLGEDITEHRRAAERLSFLAHHDELTGLPNRTLFIDRLEQAMIEAERHERLVAVVFLDVDRFKGVNDTLGHEAGDQLLQGVAERLLGAVRRGDTVARLSGDEFTLVLADLAHVDDAARVAQKILDAFAQPFHIAGRDLFMSVSLGLTLFPFDTHETQALLRNADVAMYRAKEAGRNTYQFYAAEMTTQAVARAGMENDLRLALKRGEFVLHYQPIVSCHDGRIIGVEALVRWQSPELGLVPPSQFIPLAEETGLIEPLGEWVLHAACAQLGQWKSAGFPALQMAANISVRQFRQRGLAQIVAHALSTASLAPRHLELEITESVLAQGEEAETLLREVSAAGVQFSIDDFGTGYSSLSYLKRFPIDTLKIDQSFVRDIPGDANDTAIALAIIAMAHSLGMRVIAEGVETMEQKLFMQQHGCDAMQGYFFSKPLPAGELTLLLANGSAWPAKQ